MARVPARAASLGVIAALAGLSLVATPTAYAAPGDDDSGLQMTDRSAQRIAPTSRQIAYRGFDSGPDWRSGQMAGVRVGKGALVLKAPSKKRSYAGRRYDVGAWNSPWVSPGFGASELIASWSASTPADTWIEIRVRGRSGATKSSWDVLGRWASGDRFVKRTTATGQTDDLAKVNVDTWQSQVARGMTSYQLQVSLMRRSGTSASPSVDTAGAVASRLPAGTPATSKPGVARGITLPVPSYSQMIHRGHLPQFGNGGEAWCSPTATSMVLGYYRRLPVAQAKASIGNGHPDPWVDYAARATYDHAYDGTGNWPFNTAYAAQLAGKGFVTRLRSLHEAERFIKAGIPLVASVSFGRGELSGAPISSSNGHLMVIVGFTRTGNVVVNDPAASSNAGVRRVYDRAQFERVWLPKSGGLVYVIRDAAHPLPQGRQTNW